MSGATAKTPKAATVEDWDDDAETALPGTRASANVAVKRAQSSGSESSDPLPTYKYDGTDSGYSSIAPTVASMAAPGRKVSDLKLDTAVIAERERKPYAHSAIKQAADRQLPVRQKEKEKEKDKEPKSDKTVKTVKKPFCHEKGKCWVCDKYGQHIDPKDLEKEKKQPSKPSKTSTVAAPPSSPNATRTPAARQQVPESARPTATRRPSTSATRPSSMFVNAPSQISYQQPPPVVPAGWPAPTPPPPTIAYAQYYPPPGTPVSAVPHGYFAPPTPVYYEPPSRIEDLPRRQARRMSVSQQDRSVLERPSAERSAPERRMSKSASQRPVLQERRPSILSHKSSRSIDVDKKISDKEKMPPPPRPAVSTTVASSRPKMERASNTYDDAGVKRRSQRYNYESTDESDMDEPTPRVQASPSRRPPSAYKPVVPQELAERPSLAAVKSHSYADGDRVTYVESSSARNSAMPRRTTTGSVSMEEKEAAAEAYQRKRSSQVNELTAENLSNLKTVVSRNIEQRSEAGSTASHRTHQSSSKDSSNGHARPAVAATNINIDGLRVSIPGSYADGSSTPVTIELHNGIQISMNKENMDAMRRPMKQLERAPSTTMSSRPSRRSLTNGGQLSGSHLRREDPELLALEGPQEASRRPSNVDEHERELLRSAKNSRQPSRVGSARPSIEGMRRATNSHRNSVEYAKYEDMNLYAI